MTCSRPLQSVDVDAAFSVWAAAVEDGGSFPRIPPARLVDFEGVWIRGASSTQVAFLAEELVGVYFVAPNFTGPCAHIAKGGYVCFNVWRADGTTIAREPVIPGDRHDIRERSALVAMHMLRELLGGRADGDDTKTSA